jgi:hypothetical protein
VSVQKKGYVALLKTPLKRAALDAIVVNWLMRFDMVEQLKSRDQKIAAFAIRAPKDVVWEKDLQFRVMAGEQFTWVYLTAAGRIIETDGLADPSKASLALDVLTGIAGCQRVVSDHDDRTLDQWEKKGLM